MNFPDFDDRLKEQIQDVGLPANTEYCEVHKGTTPNGGDYSVAYFYDKEHKPCKRKDAKFVNIIEYSKSGDRVNEAYATIGQEIG